MAYVICLLFIHGVYIIMTNWFLSDNDFDHQMLEWQHWKTKLLVIFHQIPTIFNYMYLKTSWKIRLRLLYLVKNTLFWTDVWVSDRQHLCSLRLSTICKNYHEYELRPIVSRPIFVFIWSRIYFKNCTRRNKSLALVLSSRVIY